MFTGVLATSLKVIEILENYQNFFMLHYSNLDKYDLIVTIFSLCPSKKAFLISGSYLSAVWMSKTRFPSK